MNFVPAFSPRADDHGATLWFIFDGQQLLVRRESDDVSIPDSEQLAASGIVPIGRQFLGYLDGRACQTGELRPAAPVTVPYVWMDLRGLLGAVDDTLFWIAGRANHLMDWDRTHRYCGRCGRPTADRADERAKHCPACGLVNYPRLSPAVIMAVLRDDTILLARNRRFKRPFYSVLAGFVEPGETLEQCVRREIREEVGLEVENIRYFGSQPWPFPNSLMVAFVADYAGGEIRVDNVELMTADWFRARSLPPVPPRISIARQLIDWFVARSVT